jgi:hypothetical protein
VTNRERTKRFFAWCWWSVGIMLFGGDEDEQGGAGICHHTHIHTPLVMHVFTPDSDQAKSYVAQIAPELYGHG